MTPLAFEDLFDLAGDAIEALLKLIFKRRRRR